MPIDTPQPIVRKSGYALVEIIVALTIVGVLVAIGLPGLAGARRSMGVEQAADQFARDLSRSRVDAARKDRTVVIRRVNNYTYRLDDGVNRSLPDGVEFAPGSPDSVLFASFGPSAGATMSFELRLNGRVKTVAVRPSGLVTIR